MDAGGLAHMSYNNFPNNGGLGVPGSGFASRGKGAHIKRLSVQPPALNTSGQDEAGTGPTTPRTSRSHLLAGLRTAARSNPAPPSAPPMQSHHGLGGLGDSRYADQGTYQSNARAVPQTATGSSFPSHQSNRFPMNTGRQMYAVPEQVLAPPALQLGPDPSEEIIDPNLYAELVATNLYLAQQQQRLQQQLMSVTAAAQQYQGVNVNGQGGMMPQQYSSPNTGYLGQSMSMNVNAQSMIAPVPGAQGWYSVFDQMTGQQTYYFDSNSQAAPVGGSPPSQQGRGTSPPQSETPRLEVSPPPTSNHVPVNFQTAISPPKSISPPQMSPSLPPPSANAFRRGHKKTSSMANSINVNGVVTDGLKTGAPKTAGFPATPMTGTFGPGQARSGEHPIRQPRAPPPMEELLAKPTAKHEGSKNFASRQRRNAVSNLVRAGLERRTGRHTGSAGSTTPASEGEITFSVDDETGSMGSGSLSGKPSIGSLRAAANGAIGSERKEMKERSQERESIGSHYTTKSVSSDEGAMGGKLTEVMAETSGERRKTPMLVLTSAEKRKSSMF